MIGGAMPPPRREMRLRTGRTGWLAAAKYPPLVADPRTSRVMRRASALAPLAAVVAALAISACGQSQSHEERFAASSLTTRDHSSKTT